MTGFLTTVQFQDSLKSNKINFTTSPMPINNETADILPSNILLTIFAHNAIYNHINLDGLRTCV